MHRSGTSAVTRTLNLLGAELPKKIQPAAEDNEAGFWEDYELIAIHEALLARGGTAWDDVSALPASFYRSAAVDEAADAILRILRIDFDTTPLFVIKEPRIARLIPLWLRVLVALPAEPHFVIMVRNPLEVAASLAKRNRMTLSKSLLLWLRYNLEVEKSTRGEKRIFVSYHDLLDDWRSVATAISERLEIPWPRLSHQASVEIDRFLMPELRHHQTPAATLQARSDVSDWAKEVYATILEAASQSGEPASDSLERVSHELNRADKAFGPLIADDRVNLTELQEQLDTTRCSLREREESTRELSQNLSERDAQITVATERIRSLEAESRSLSEQLAMQRLTVEERDRQFSELSNQVAHLSRELTEGQAREQEVHRASSELSNQVANLSRELTERQAREQEVHRASSELSNQVANLSRELTEGQAREQEASRALSTQACQLSAIRSEIAGVYGSRTWRVAKSLRLLKAFVRDLPRLPRQSIGKLADVARALRPRPRERERRIRTLIHDSGLFDANWYRKRNPDVAAEDADPLDHWLTHGLREERDPSPWFETTFYLARNMDVAATGTNPLAHYIEHGAAERRDPSPRFCTGFYLESYPDVAAANINPLAHYIQSGAAEGRICIPGSRVEPRPSTGESVAVQLEAERFDHEPLISVIMPTHNSEPDWLTKAVNSVIDQTYQNWELLVIDDGSTDSRTVPTIKSMQSMDDRIKPTFCERNRGISSASNTGIQRANGEWIAFLDHDDELTADALYEVAKAFNTCPEVDVIYSDQDKIDLNDRTSEPFFKPDWSPELFRGVMYVGHLLVARRELVDAVGRFDSNFDGVQDYELMLRLSERTDRIAHIPKILYHWRTVPGSVAAALDAKKDIDKLQVEAVSAHLKRRGIRGIPERHPVHRHRVVIRPAPLEREPRVSIIIPTRDAPEHIERCLGSLYNRTTWKNFDVIVVDNGTTNEAALNTLKTYPVDVLAFNETFNFSRANNLGAQRAQGDYLVLLNNDTEIITSDWIEAMEFHMRCDEVGAVGPLLIYPDRTVQHAGVVLGFRGTADHVMRRFPSDCDGYAGSLSCAREVSAVTGACMMLRRDEYLAMGGLVEHYSTAYQDVDLCLRLLARGKRIIFTPRAVLLHFESATRNDFYDRYDRALLLDSWGSVISDGDEYYNPNFSLDHVDYTLSAGTGFKGKRALLARASKALARRWRRPGTAGVGG